MSLRAVVLFVLAIALPGCRGCVGAPGVIAEARPDTRFVTERSPLIVSTGRGIESIATDGSDRRVIFARRGDFNWLVIDVSPDFRMFLLGTSDTELFVGDVATGAVRQVPAPGRRMSTARFSPDGKRIAIARHQDFHETGAKDDDTIYIVDTATLVGEVIPPATDHWPATLRWANDGSGLWVTMNFGAEPQWIALPEKTRRFGMNSAPTTLQEGARPDPPLCQQRVLSDSGTTTIRIAEAGTDPANGGRVIVDLRGRERGFHDYASDFDSPTLSPKCAYVVFGFNGAVWIADVRGGAAASVLEGASALFFMPQKQ